MTDYVKEYLKEHPERRSGRTTRLADLYIQQLFTEGEVKITDHHPHHYAHEELARRILRRLQAEHQYVEVKYTRSTLKIEIRKETE